MSSKVTLTRGKRTIEVDQSSVATLENDGWKKGAEKSESPTPLGSAPSSKASQQSDTGEPKSGDGKPSVKAQ